jgi:hypothetical protein
LDGHVDLIKGGITKWTNATTIINGEFVWDEAITMND